MSIKLVHIGLGKTATTTLQKIIFPTFTYGIATSNMNIHFTIFTRGVLLPGAPSRAFLNKFKQREQIYHLQL